MVAYGRFPLPTPRFDLSVQCTEDAESGTVGRSTNDFRRGDCYSRARA